METRFFTKQPEEAEESQEDQKYEQAVAKLEAIYADPNSDDILKDLKETIYSYTKQYLKLREFEHADNIQNQSVLQQQELLRLPKVFDRKTREIEGNNVQGDKDFLANFFVTLSKEPPDLKHPYLLQKADALTSIVSLDPCTCSSACPPLGLNWLLSLLVLSG